MMLLLSRLFHLVWCFEDLSPHLGKAGGLEAPLKEIPELVDASPSSLCWKDFGALLKR